MAINFFSSSTIPSEGTLGREVAIQRKRQEGVEAALGQQCSFYGYLVTGAIDENRVLNKMEDHMGLSSGSLSWGNSIQSNDNCDNFLFRSTAGDYYDVDFSANHYKRTSEKDMLASFGIDYADRPDIVTLNQGGFNFYEFVGTGLGDGVQNGFSLSGKFDNIKWGTTTYVQAELNPYYWIANDGSYESYKANTYLDLIKGNANQFMTASEITALSNITDYAQWSYNMACIAAERLLA